MDNLNLPNNLLEQSTLEYLWCLVDKGILKHSKMNGEYVFKVSPKYIDEKDKIIRRYEERLFEITEFYSKTRVGETDVSEYKKD